MTYPARGVGPPSTDADIEELFARVRALEAEPDIEEDAPPLPIIASEQQITSLADSTEHTIDFSAGVTRTNDGDLAWPGSPSDPFSGDCYSFDWGANPNQINIIASGEYVVRSYWQILLTGGTWATVGQNFLGLIMRGVGDWGNANDSNNMDGIAAHNNGGGPPGFNTAFKTMDEKVLLVTGATPSVPVSLVVAFAGQPALTVSSGFAGISIVRLGNIS